MCTRRAVLGTLAGAGLVLARRSSADERSSTDARKAFIAAAFAMKEQAVRAGDQPYGAVVVRGEEVVGHGPSRVVQKRDWTAHAEREAIRDAQAGLGAATLTGCVMYSTSRPCGFCETAAAEAGIERMFFGAKGVDAGRPRRT